MKTGGIAVLALLALRRHALRTALLVACVAVTLALPLVSRAGLDAYAAALRAEAERAPLLVGPWGRRTDLLLDVCALRRNRNAVVAQGLIDRARRGTGLRAVRLHLRHGAGGAVLVGTDPGYFELQGLRCERGELPLRLGDCVLGTEVAAATGLGPGDRLRSDARGPLDVSGGFALRLRVTGVLAPTGRAPDRAVFCDVKTAWVLDGIGHGHAAPGAAAAVEGEAPVLPDPTTYRAIDGDNLAAFHFHGDPADFPVNAAICHGGSPDDALILRGRLTHPEDGAQAVASAAVLDELLATVLRVHRVLAAFTAVLAGVSILLLVLVGLLAWRLRAREMATLAAIGIGRRAIAALVACEWVAVLGAGSLLALAAAWLARGLAAHLVASLITAT